MLPVSAIELYFGGLSATLSSGCHGTQFLELPPTSWPPWSSPPTAVIGGGVAPETPVRVRPLVRFMSGPPGGGFYPLESVWPGLQALAAGCHRRDISEHWSGHECSVDQRGDADLALVFADVTYIAFVCRLPGSSEAFKGLRGVAVLSLRRFISS